MMIQFLAISETSGIHATRSQGTLTRWRIVYRREYRLNFLAESGTNLGRCHSEKPGSDRGNNRTILWVFFLFQ